MGPSKRFDYLLAGFVYGAAVSRYVHLQHEHPSSPGATTRSTPRSREN